MRSFLKTRQVSGEWEKERKDGERAGNVRREFQGFSQYSDSGCARNVCLL